MGVESSLGWVGNSLHGSRRIDKRREDMIACHLVRNSFFAGGVSTCTV